MDLTQLANLGEFIGGVAVLVTLIYLAVQVRHTRVQQDAQALDAAFQTSFAAGEVLFYGDNPRVIQAGVADLDSVPPEDQALFGMLMSRQLGAVVMLGRSDDLVARAQLAHYKAFFDLPGAQEWFANLPPSPLKTLSAKAFTAVPDSGDGRGIVSAKRD